MLYGSLLKQPLPRAVPGATVRSPKVRPHRVQGPIVLILVTGWRLASPLTLPFSFTLSPGVMSSSDIQVGPATPAAGRKEEGSGTRAPLLPPIPRVIAPSAGEKDAGNDKAPVVSPRAAETSATAPPPPVDTSPAALPEML